MLRKYFRTTPYFIKLFNREYWPIWANYLPVYPYFLFLAARARSFFFFSACNPSIETGGMIGESKINILHLIDDKYKPKTIFIPKNTPFNEVISKIKNAEMPYPIILKPDIGERGLLVSKIDDEAELEDKLAKNQIDFIIQEYIPYTEEYAIMYYRYPDEEEGKIISVCKKGFLSVTGDGKSTLEELIWDKPRAILQWEKLKVKFKNELEVILPKGEEKELVPIGNHSTGTMFMDANHIIDKDLERVFDKIALGMEGVYFGRFDLRCRSLEDLKAGKTINIVEFNGVGAEPAHMYDPKCSLWKGYSALLRQWTIMFRVGRAVHHQKSIPYMTLSEMRAHMKKIRLYKEGLKL